MIHNLPSAMFGVLILFMVGLFCHISFHTIKARREFRRYFGVNYHFGYSRNIKAMNLVRGTLYELWRLAEQAEMAEDRDRDEIDSLVTSIPNELLLFVSRTRKHSKLKADTLAKINDFNRAREIAITMGFEEETRVFGMKISVRKVQTY